LANSEPLGKLKVLQRFLDALPLAGCLPGDIEAATPQRVVQREAASCLQREGFSLAVLIPPERHFSFG
jgi:hypothetical protein